LSVLQRGVAVAKEGAKSSVFLNSRLLRWTIFCQATQHRFHTNNSKGVLGKGALSSLPTTLHRDHGHFMREVAAPFADAAVVLVAFWRRGLARMSQPRL